MNFCKSFYAFVIFTLVVSSNAMALSQCIKLSPTSGTCTSTNVTYKNVDAIVDCNGVSVSIVSVCGASTGTADTTALDSITISSTTPANNKYCWCKIISPVATKWIYRYAYTSNTNCAYSCVRGCANAFLYAETQDVTFRTTAYSNLVY